MHVTGAWLVPKMPPHLPRRPDSNESQNASVSASRRTPSSGYAARDAYSGAEPSGPRRSGRPCSSYPCSASLRNRGPRRLVGTDSAERARLSTPREPVQRVEPPLLLSLGRVHRREHEEHHRLLTNNYIIA